MCSLHLSEGKNNIGLTKKEQLIIDADLTVLSIHYRILGTSPGDTIFGKHMLFNLPCLTDWNAVEHKCQQLANDANAKENEECVNHNYAINDERLIINKGVGHKARASMLNIFLLYKYFQMIQ